jgi:HD-GYP domain-containing protein (c-di-GMP phosphodiesterase class II)/uncharacterized membrane protein
LNIINESIEKKAVTADPPTKGIRSKKLPTNIVIVLIYLWMWVSGAVFLMLEKNDKTVRFHAWQSVIAFGTATFINCLMFLIPPLPVGIIYNVVLGLWIIIIALTIYIWILLLVTAFIKKPYTLPLVGKLAYRLTYNRVPEMPSKPTETASKFCVTCGEKLPEKAVFCPACGEKQLLEVMSKIDKLGHLLGSDKQTITGIRKALNETVIAVTLIGETRDPYTAGHQRRVTQLAKAIAIEMNLSPSQIEGLDVAGQLHDLGKISIPSDILNKPGRLSEGEYIIIKGHPQISYDILKTIEFPWPVAQIAYQHHERINGSGYPRGLKGDDMLLEAKILCVADVVEAMASHRPYRAALGIDEALKEISNNKGILYDPQVVDACLTLCNEKGFQLE